MARGPPTIAASLAVAAVFLHGKTLAMPWIGPQVTPMGMMPLDGILPIPTNAPSRRLIGDSLLKRACTPIPNTVCGFVSSNTASSLTCDVGQQCVRNGNNFGCCTQTAIELCTDIYTTCVPYFAGGCGDACIANPKILKCPISSAECRTFSFAGGVTGYDCASVGGSTSVAWIESIYTSGCIPDSTTTSSTQSTATTPGSSTTTSHATKSDVTTTAPTPTDAADGAKLTSGAKAGIAIGSLAAFTALAGGILLFYISHKRITASAAATTAAGENENDKSNNTSTACTPPLVQTPSRQSGRPYSIQSTRTPPSGYYAVPTNHPEAGHQHPNDPSSNLPKKSNMRFSVPAPPTAASSAAAAALASNTHKPRARRYSTPTPAGGRMSPAVEVEGEGGDGVESIRPPGPLSMSARTSTERLPGLRGISPRQNPPPVPPPPPQGGETRRFYGQPR